MFLHAYLSSRGWCLASHGITILVALFFTQTSVLNTEFVWPSGQHRFPETNRRIRLSLSFGKLCLQPFCHPLVRQGLPLCMKIRMQCNSYFMLTGLFWPEMIKRGD